MSTAYLLSSPSLSLGSPPLLKRALPLHACSPTSPLAASSAASSSSRRLSSLAISRVRSSSRRDAVGGGSQPTLEDSTAVYQGIYGPWSVEPSDVREVHMPYTLPFCLLQKESNFRIKFLWKWGKSLRRSYWSSSTKIEPKTCIFLRERFSLAVQGIQEFLFS